jgi:hypothetical protein
MEQKEIKQQEESNGLLKKGEKFLSLHDAADGSPCVNGSGLLLVDNQKELLNLNLWVGFVAQA